MTDTITTQPAGVGNTQPIGADVTMQPPLPPGYGSVPPQPQQGAGNPPPGYGPPQPQQGDGNLLPGYGPPQPQQGYGNPPPAYGPHAQLPMYGRMPMQPLPQPRPQQQFEWMTKPEGDPKCPPGLEYLTMLDQILVKQMVEPMEYITGLEMENKYRVLNSIGQQCYFATEET